MQNEDPARDNFSQKLLFPFSLSEHFQTEVGWGRASKFKLISWVLIFIPK